MTHFADLQKDKAAADSIDEEMYFLARAGKIREVRKKLAQLVNEAAGAGDADRGREFQQSIEATIAYLQGATEQMIQLSGTVTTPEMRFARAATMGDIEAAAAALIELPRERAFRTLLLSLAAQKAGKNDRADQLRSLAVAALSAEGADARRAALWLTGAFRPKSMLHYASHYPPDRRPS